MTERKKKEKPRPSTLIALFRGINVGRAKRVAMADLREVLTELGYTNVKTLLNSGNAVFDSSELPSDAIGSGIRTALAARTGVDSRVILLTAPDLATIVTENPLESHINDPSRFLVAFSTAATDLTRSRGLTEVDHGPDRFAIGSKAAYLWCGDGILASELLKSFGRLMGDSITTRNWATVLKLHAMASGNQ